MPIQGSHSNSGHGPLWQRYVIHEIIPLLQKVIHQINTFKCWYRNLNCVAIPCWLQCWLCSQLEARWVKIVHLSIILVSLFRILATRTCETQIDEIIFQGLHHPGHVDPRSRSLLLVLRPRLNPVDKTISLRRMCLRGGEPADLSKPQGPPTMHVIAVGTMCGAILVLNEMNLVCWPCKVLFDLQNFQFSLLELDQIFQVQLSVVLRVALTFVLAIIFFLVRSLTSCLYAH